MYISAFRWTGGRWSWALGWSAATQAMVYTAAEAFHQRNHENFYNHGHTMEGYLGFNGDICWVYNGDIIAIHWIAGMFCLNNHLVEEGIRPTYFFYFCWLKIPTTWPIPSDKHPWFWKLCHDILNDHVSDWGKTSEPCLIAGGFDHALCNKHSI
jgi:hypothetical protein